VTQIESKISLARNGFAKDVRPSEKGKMFTGWRISRAQAQVDKTAINIHIFRSNGIVSEKVAYSEITSLVLKDNLTVDRSTF
jgi:hypothetical protein